MAKWKANKLHSGGPNGPVVGDQKQAVAILLSEKRKEQQNGGDYPDSQPAASGPPSARLRRLIKKASQRG